ncbi:hypothetical protein ILYODFUR_028945, partial [Ilyodon furcidens]
TGADEAEQLYRGSWKCAGLQGPPEELKLARLWPRRMPRKLLPHTHNLSQMM